MSYLEENEWMLLNEIAYKISFIYDFEAMEKETLYWMKGLISYDGALIAKVEIKERQIRLVHVVSNEIDEKTIPAWERETMRSDMTGWMLASGRNGAYKDDDGFSQKKWEERAIHRDFYVPNLFYYSIGMIITFKEEPVGLIKLYRKKEQGDFEKRDLFALDQLQKHFAYRFYYEMKKGDGEYFYARGYMEEIRKKYHFTEKENDIFMQIMKGSSNEEIAANENISIHTVRKHIQNIYGKMGVKNRIQLMQCLPKSGEKIIAGKES